MPTPLEFLAVCEEAARLGGSILQDWAGRFDTREKAPADLVTDADLASQAAIRKFLLERFPDHGFLGEEGDGLVQGDYRWVVDPLDGTTNYVHRFPNYAVSIALEHREEPIAGVVFDPTINECYKASLGGGAWLNEHRLSVSNVTHVSQALVSVSFPSRVQRNSQDLADFVEVLVEAQAIRRLGSAALSLCYLAAGRFDAYWATATKIWDVAAARLIVTEAGGLFTGFDGEPFRPVPAHFLAASTPALHQQMYELLHRTR